MRLFLTIGLIGSALQLHAQLVDGRTYVTDTTYSLQREYRKILPQYPRLQLPVYPDAGSFRMQKDISYCSTGNISLRLDVFQPAAGTTANGIALILLHGGGWRSGDKTLLQPMAACLAIKGYTCFTPEYRLSTHALYPAAVLDVKAAVQWVRANAASMQVDPQRIVIAGHSAGGQLAALAGATNGLPVFEKTSCTTTASGLVQAVVNMDGILAFLHPESGEGNDSLRTSAATYWFGYPKHLRPDLWQEASPLTHVGAHTPPFLFFNSSVPRMRAGQDDFIQELNRFGIYSRVMQLERAPHSFALFQPWLDTVVQVTDEFLQHVFVTQQRNHSFFIPGNIFLPYNNPALYQQKPAFT
ncbi:MAG TPA: alpha/beta hydrolase [Lacibacter sp.]|nr:alpha/beta hydrolase [Lacibacter sp.]HMO89206.1 alpha/beta hydrolase [Lacibacter sp.]HMP88381.1 alpha/beta hydrolase [Lacibacter sp.]